MKKDKIEIETPSKMYVKWKSLQSTLFEIQSDISLGEYSNSDNITYSIESEIYDFLNDISNLSKKSGRIASKMQDYKK